MVLYCYKYCYYSPVNIPEFLIITFRQKNSGPEYEWNHIFRAEAKQLWDYTDGQK